MSESVKFIHVFEHGQKGGLTIAHQSRWLENQLEVTVGVAFCSPRDQYSRKRGAVISTGRLQTHPITFLLAEVPTTQEIHAHVIALLKKGDVAGQPDRLKD